MAGLQREAQPFFAFAQGRVGGLASRLVGKAIQREADIPRHFQQQLASVFVERVHCRGVERQGASYHAIALQRQRGGGGPAKAGGACMPGAVRGSARKS